MLRFLPVITLEVGNLLFRRGPGPLVVPVLGPYVVDVFITSQEAGSVGKDILSVTFSSYG